MFIICLLLAGLLIVGVVSTIDKEADEYWSRLPKTGEKVMMDGRVITIMDYGVAGGIAHVRYDNGHLSKILEKEILDAKILKDGDKL